MSEAIVTIAEKENQNSQNVMLAHEPFFKKWGGLFILSLGLAIVIIDTTLLNVSLGVIIKDLKTDLQSIQWVITAYALVLAAFTITGGRLGDLFGRKRMFMLGAIIFAAGSFMASVSHSIPMLLLGESIIEGFGAALMMPATASLVVANFRGADRSKAFGIWGAVAGASSALGPLLGGYLTSHYSWRWGFRINVFVAAIVILGSLWLIKESRDERKPKLDWGGVVLSSLGLLSLVFGIIESSTYGWWKAKEAFVVKTISLDLWGYSIVPFAIALGVLLLAVFMWWEKVREDKGRSVLVTSHIFQNRQFTVGTLAIAVLTLAMSGQLFALPVFLQSVKGLDAFKTGLAMLPLSATLLVVAPISGLLSKKIQQRYLIWTGLVITVVAPFIIAAQLAPDMPLSHLIPGLILYGIGMGLLFPPISDLTLSAVPVDMAGEASGVNNTFRHIGTTLGVAIIGAAVLTSLGSSLAKGINASPVIPSEYKQQIASKLSSPNANVEFGGENNLPVQLSSEAVQEINNIAKLATTQSNKDAYTYAALFALIALIIALFLPATHAIHHVEGQHVVLDEEPVARRRYALAVLLMVAAVAGAWYFLKQSSDKTLVTGTPGDTAESIRNAFAPDNNQSQNAFTATSTTVSNNDFISNTATSTPVISPATTTASSTAAPSKETLRGGKVLGSATSAPAPAPVPTVYTNSIFGFQVTLDANWQAQELKNNVVGLVSRYGGQDTIEVYDGFTGSLDEITRQLSGSKSVKETHPATFHGQQAVGFTTSAGMQGIAFVRGGKLYYITAKNLDAVPLASFIFI